MVLSSFECEEDFLSSETLRKWILVIEVWSFWLSRISEVLYLNSSSLAFDLVSERMGSHPNAQKPNYGVVISKQTTKKTHNTINTTNLLTKWKPFK